MQAGGLLESTFIIQNPQKACLEKYVSLCCPLFTYTFKPTVSHKCKCNMPVRLHKMEMIFLKFLIVFTHPILGLRKLSEAFAAAH